jgi:PHD/YefM family antitoxin component YafN of YafNO toxin-antitoxin module
MPAIRKSADLRNHYGEISAYCHENREPVFITRNGEGDLAVMSMEEYDLHFAAQDLYRELQKGMDDIEAGRVVTEEELDASLDEVFAKYV